MYDPKAQPPGSGGASGLEARIERIRQSLAAQQARLTRGSMLTASIGAILCALMAFWFYYGYVKITEVMTPQTMIQAAETYVMDLLPKARAELESSINDSADDWAADISKQVQSNMPDVRRHMEEFIVSKSSQAIDQFQVLTASQFRTFVHNNQPMLADGFRSLKKQEDADRFVQDLHLAVEQQLAGDMRSQAEDMLHTLIDLNAKLDSLAKGEKLNHEQALEQEILMIARRLQLETQSDTPPDPTEGVSTRRTRKAASSKVSATTDQPSESGTEQAAAAGTKD